MAFSYQTYEVAALVAGLGAVIAAGVFGFRRMRGGTAVEYFLAGRSARWYMIACSLFITSIWGVWFSGLALSAEWKASGRVLASVVIVGGLAALGWVFAPRARAAGDITVTGPFADRFGARVGLLVSIASVLFTLAVRIPLAIIVGSRSMHLLLGWDPLSTALLMIVIPGLFAVAGGLAAALATQVVYAAVAAGSLALLGIMGAATDGSVFPAVIEGGNAHWVVFAGCALVIGFWYSCVDQFVVQRAYAARSEDEAKRGVLTAALLVLLGAAALSTGASRPFPSVAAGMPDQGLAAGLLGAAMLSMLMATLSSHFMSVSTLVTLDVFRAFRSSQDETALVLVGRLVNTIVVIVAILAASSAALVDGPAFGVLVQSFGVVAPPLVAVRVAGAAWERMHGRGALWALCGGWAVGALFLFLRAGNAGSMPVMVETTLASLLASLAILMGVSLSSSPARAGAPSRPLLGNTFGARKP
jgi:SSS family solute:Na+ symporter